MDENLKNEIRSLVQEEMSGSSRASTSPSNRASTSGSNQFTSQPGQNIVSRTRDLIRQSVESVTSTPNHNLRLSSRGKRKATKEIKKTTLEVCVLKKHNNKEYTILESSVVLKQVMVNMLETMEDKEIKSVIANAIGSTLMVDPDDFDYVKRDRNTIIVPNCTNDFRWGYSEIKKLCGQGKLYVQLKGAAIILDDSDDDDIEATTFQTTFQTTLQTVTASSSSAAASSSSAATEPTEDHLVTLKNLFPHLSDEKIHFILSQSDSLEEAAEAAAEIGEAEDESCSNNETTSQFGLKTIFEIFKKLSSCMNSEKKPITINHDNIVSDLLSFYKNINFDSKYQWRVSFSGQSGVDAGGLTRELFGQFFKRLADASGGNHLFEGEKFLQVPVSRTDTCISGIFRYIGVILAHALCHGVRPLKLPESAYVYIVTGSIEKAVPYVNVDAASASIKHFSNEVFFFIYFSIFFSDTIIG